MFLWKSNWISIFTGWFSSPKTDAFFSKQNKGLKTPQTQILRGLPQKARYILTCFVVVFWFKRKITRWFKPWPFDPPCWRSLNHFNLWKGHLTIPKRSPPELPGMFGFQRFTSKHDAVCSVAIACYSLAAEWLTWKLIVWKRKRTPQIWWFTIEIQCLIFVGR